MINEESNVTVWQAKFSNQFASNLQAELFLESMGLAADPTLKFSIRRDPKKKE